MKKILIISAIAFITGCRGKDKDHKTTTKDNSSTISPVKVDTLLSVVPYDSILANARLLVDHIKNKDFDKVSAFVSVDSGLRFSPQSYISKTDLMFSKEQLSSLWNNEKKYEWGIAEGSGEPIIKKFAEYYQLYIYPRDFAKAPNIEINKTLRGNTTSIANFKEVYPGSVNVDFYFPNSGEEVYDWATLRFLFIKENGKWYLFHVSHEGYSI